MVVVPSVKVSRYEEVRSQVAANSKGAGFSAQKRCSAEHVSHASVVLSCCFLKI